MKYHVQQQQISWPSHAYAMKDHGQQQQNKMTLCHDERPQIVAAK